MIDHILVFIAFITNNVFGKRKDLNGRQYRYVYKKFGHKAMLRDYHNGNSWRI
jgi:hypothetical protein